MAKHYRVVTLLLFAIVAMSLSLNHYSVCLAQSAVLSPERTSTSIPLPKILKVLKKGKASELKHVLVKMQDNKDVIVSFRAEGKRFYVTGKRKSEVYGDIGADGKFKPTARVNDKILKIIREVEKDPVAYARSHGLKTGRCCCCGRKLTDPRSMAAGYGPVCAENFGFPWGK